MTAVGVVLHRAGGLYRVHVDEAVREATLRGRVKRGRDRVLVGDRVRLAEQADGTLTIEAVEPRRSVLRRRTPGRGHGERPVAANVEQVVVVGSVRDPDWDGFMMDRFAAVAEANGLPVLVVVNKIDLDPEGRCPAGAYRAAGYDVLLTSATAGTGVPELRERLQGRESLFTGLTGVGKSSLLNAVAPGLSLRTGEVSRRSRTGRHTTVAAEAHPLPGGGYVVDTPGLRDIGLWGLEPHEVMQAFPELRRFAGQCRFDNCRHLEEPDCAVSAASERGEIDMTRLTSYRKMLHEAERAARPWQ